MKAEIEELIKEAEEIESEIRGWSIVVSNLKKSDAPLEVWKCAANEVSKRAKRLSRLKGIAQNL